MIKVFLDNNVWDFIYENEIDLRKYFPRDKFQLLISKHGRFEINQIPDRPDNKGFKKYISSMLSTEVEEQHTFGFYDPKLSEDEQRTSGFGVGVLTDRFTENERQRLRKIYASDNKRKEDLILYKQEADIELGALSVHHFVLTFDSKPGPLKDASENGGKVIFLNEFLSSSGEEIFEEALTLIEKDIIHA